MPAYAEHRRTVRPRERLVALAAVAIVQAAVGLVLVRGLQVSVGHAHQFVQQLIAVTLTQAPPPPPPTPLKPVPAPRKASAPKAAPAKLGGSPGPRPAHAPPSVAPVVPVAASAAPSGGGSGTGPAAGAGAGGGTGGLGTGSGGGSSEVELISGDISPRDYPKRLGNAGVGGTVTVTFTVPVNGRPSGCRVTRSSGVPELDGLTCRLIEQRFVFRPATDRYGRPVSDEVEWDQDWIPHR